MADRKEVALNQSEIRFLLLLIEEREREGWYSGNKSFFELREQSIKNKLMNAANILPQGEAGKEGA
jgi:hypothetical protein